MIQTIILSDIESSVVTALSNKILYVAVGTGSSPESITSTQLDSEVLREAIISPIATSNSYSVAMYLDVTKANGNTITEIGTFEGTVGGTMVSRDLTTSNAKTSSKEFYYELVNNVTVINN